MPVPPQLDGGTSEFTASVTAVSSLSFLAEYCLLEMSPPRPGYRIISGYPISGECISLSLCSSWLLLNLVFYYIYLL